MIEKSDSISPALATIAILGQPPSRDYVEREEARENFKQNALASWTVYQETRRHLTGREVRDWLNAWGTDKETEVPQCHE